MSLSHSVESFLGHVPTYYCRRNEESTSSTHIKERHAYTRQRTPRHRRHLGWHRTDSGHQRLQLVRFPADDEPTPNGSTTPASKITVVATLNQWGSLAKQIGGNQVEVSSILPPDTTNAHSFEPNAKQVTQMRKAQVLLTNGAGYDTWAEPFTSPERDTGVRGRHSGCIGWRQPTPVVLT